MQKKDKDLDELANLISRKLIDAGIIIHRYDSYSTNSIYLKLDYGVCNSIRISDHPGKKHLRYRYNIGPKFENQRKVQQGYERFFFLSNDPEKLINKVISDRERKIQHYGKEKFQEYISDNKEKSRFCKGFWTQAYLVGR